MPKSLVGRFGLRLVESETPAAMAGRRVWRLEFHGFPIWLDLAVRHFHLRGVDHERQAIVLLLGNR